MIAGFITWSSVALLLIGIAIWSWNSKKPAGFYAGSEPPKVKDVEKYNHAVALLWILYAVLFELSGFPFLFAQQNSPAFIVTILIDVIITIGLIIVYNRILGKYQQN